MPLKRRPSDEELNQLAAEFRGKWQPGNVIRPWLRKHQARLTALVAEDWSWATLADALTRAGITYRSQRPWTGDGLKAEVRRASLPLKSRGRGKAPSPAAQLPAPAEPATPQQADAAVGPKFRPARPKPYDPPRPLTEADERERAAVQKKFYG